MSCGNGLEFENEYYEVIDNETGEVLHTETDYGNAAEYSQAMWECEVDTDVVIREGTAKVVDGRYVVSRVVDGRKTADILSTAVGV